MTTATAHVATPAQGECADGSDQRFQLLQQRRAKLGGIQVSEAQRLLTEAHRDMHALVAVCDERWALPCRENSHINGLLRNA
jgi:hypothetical protein